MQPNPHGVEANVDGTGYFVQRVNSCGCREFAEWQQIGFCGSIVLNSHQPENLNGKD
jgi:hypothetical protein